VLNMARLLKVPVAFNEYQPAFMAEP